jgi:hypothetical protein
VTTHENSTTMSLYGYDLAWYVVEASLYQPDVQGSCDGGTTGMCDEAVMAEPSEGVVDAAMAQTHKAQEGASGGVRCSHWR